MSGLLPELAQLLARTRGDDPDADFDRSVLELARIHGGVERVELIPIPLAGPAEGQHEDLPIVWCRERLGLLRVSGGPADARARADLELIARIIGLFHMRSRRLHDYDDARRALRTTRDRLEQQQRQLQVQQRDPWSTLLDLRAILSAASEGQAASLADPIPGLIGDSAALARVRQEVLRAARLDLPVLIEGESGTGKELVARAIHRLGLRAHRPLLSFDCAGTDIGRVEAELFGHEAGAFSGASGSRKGLLLRAQGGTVLLDEIGELPLEYQAKLLRAVEGKAVRPLGGEAQAVDFQVIATTRMDVDQALRSGRLDRGLFYRLAVTRLRLPPLREHAQDIPLILRQLLQSERVEMRIAPAVLERLLAYRWPGNVREFSGLVTRWIHLAEDDIEWEHLPPPMQAAPARSEAQGRPRSLRDVEQDIIRRALAQAQGDKTLAARTLGITRTTLYAKIRALGLEQT